MELESVECERKKEGERGRRGDGRGRRKERPGLCATLWPYFLVVSPKSAFKPLYWAGLLPFLSFTICWVSSSFLTSGDICTYGVKCYTGPFGLQTGHCIYVMEERLPGISASMMIKDSKFSLVQRHEVPLNTEIAEKHSKQINGIWKGSRKPHTRGETYKEKERGLWKRTETSQDTGPFGRRKIFPLLWSGVWRKTHAYVESWGFVSKETSWFLHFDFRLTTKLIRYWNSVDKALTVLFLIMLNWNTKIHGFDLHNLLWLKILICS